MQGVPPPCKEMAAVFIQHVCRKSCVKLLSVLCATFDFALGIYKASFRKKILYSHCTLYNIVQIVDVSGYGSLQSLLW